MRMSKIRSCLQPYTYQGANSDAGVRQVLPQCWQKIVVQGAEYGRLSTDIRAKVDLVRIKVWIGR